MGTVYRHVQVINRKTLNYSTDVILSWGEAARTGSSRTRAAPQPPDSGGRSHPLACPFHPPAGGGLCT